MFTTDNFWVGAIGQSPLQIKCWILILNWYYISQDLFEKLYEQQLKLITRYKKNMKQKLVKLIDKILLRKRALIETVNDQLKNILQIEHSRHRSVWNFLVNLIAGLIAYTYLPHKPSLDLEAKALSALPPAVF